MTGLLSRSVLGGCVAVAALLAGCGSTPMNRAPVEDRGIGAKPTVGMDPRTQAVKQLPGFENAGKPGYAGIAYCNRHIKHCSGWQCFEAKKNI